MLREPGALVWTAVRLNGDLSAAHARFAQLSVAATDPLRRQIHINTLLGKNLESKKYRDAVRRRENGAPGRAAFERRLPISTGCQPAPGGAREARVLGYM